METKTRTKEFDEWIHTGVVSHWVPGHVVLVHPLVEGVGVCPTVPWLSRIHDLDIPNYHTKILMFRILVLSSLTCLKSLKSLYHRTTPNKCQSGSLFSYLNVYLFYLRAVQEVKKINSPLKLNSKQYCTALSRL